MLGYFKKLTSANKTEKEAKKELSTENKETRKDFNAIKKDISNRAADVEVQCMLELNNTLETCYAILEKMDAYMSSITQLTKKIGVLEKFLNNMKKENKMFPWNISKINVAEIADLLDMVEKMTESPQLLTAAATAMADKELTNAFGNINTLAVEAIQQDEKYASLCLALKEKDKELAQLYQNAVILDKTLAEDSPVTSKLDEEAAAKTKRNEAIKSQYDSNAKRLELLKAEIRWWQDELAKVEHEPFKADPIKRTIKSLKKKEMIGTKMQAALNIERLVNEGRLKQIEKEKASLKTASTDAWKKLDLAVQEKDTMKADAQAAKDRCLELEQMILEKRAEAEAKVLEADKKMEKSNSKLAKFYADCRLKDLCCQIYDKACLLHWRLSCRQD